VRRGPLLMGLAALCFTVMLALVKLCRGELGAYEIVLWRGLSAVPLAALGLRGRGLGVANRPVLLLRCLFGFVGMGLYFSATAGLSVADLSLLSRLQPMVIALAAPLVLGRDEAPPRGIAGVMALGLVGCALIIGPDLRVGALAGLVALGGMLSSAAAHLTLRKLGPSDHPAVVVFWFQLSSSVLALPAAAVAAGGAWPALPSPGLWPAVLGVGAMATLGQALMTRAYRAERAAAVAAADYSAPVWALLLDLALFGLWPEPLALAGGALVVGAGLWLVTRRG
jgi:drug/metabolite transporter (DMT)-like permease